MEWTLRLKKTQTWMGTAACVPLCGCLAHILRGKDDWHLCLEHKVAFNAMCKRDILFIYLFIYLFITGFIGVTLVNEIIQVSGVQFYNASSAYCIVCSPSKIKSPSVTIYPAFTFFCLPYPRIPLVITILLSVFDGFIYLFTLLNPITFVHPAPQPSSPLTAVSLFSVSKSLFLF